MTPPINIICSTPPASPLLPEPPWTCCMCGERFDNESIALTHICRDATRTLDQYAFEAMKVLLPTSGMHGAMTPDEADECLARLMAVVDRVTRQKVEQRRALTEAMWQGRKAKLQEIAATGQAAGDAARASNGDAPMPPTYTLDGGPLIVVPSLRAVQ